jgi:hypothetical protein
LFFKYKLGDLIMRRIFGLIFVLSLTTSVYAEKLTITYQGDSYEVLDHDLLNANTDAYYFDGWGAHNACLTYGNGWRLPLSEELNEIYKQLHLKGIGSFSGYYWSDSVAYLEYKPQGKAVWYAWIQNFDGYGYEGANTQHVSHDSFDNYIKVRCIKKI